ncbi:CAP domain-containing protein [Aquisphaera giovannonii]|uniref:CAP domain-containing protein n=1 Tax=Aquisphaera giovannonii TaxID=406548 RepID=UPI00143D1F50|nr:CAP domain-containing protein [Aquisphaera giovannonii]
MPAADPIDGPITPDEQAVLILTNQYRIANGLPTLAWNPALSRAARSQCRAMAAAGMVSHTISGVGPADRIAAQGFDATAWGENLYAGFLNYGTPTAAVDGWVASETHRENLLNATFQNVGIGVATVDGVSYFTQDFGTSR